VTAERRPTTQSATWPTSSGSPLGASPSRGRQASGRTSEGADLTSTLNLTQEQVDSAFTNKGTTLPPGLDPSPPKGD
jgi:hypothetical protein